MKIGSKKTKAKKPSKTKPTIANTRKRIYALIDEMAKEAVMSRNAFLLEMMGLYNDFNEMAKKMQKERQGRWIERYKKEHKSDYTRAQLNRRGHSLELVKWTGLDGENVEETRLSDKLLGSLQATARARGISIGSLVGEAVRKATA